MSSLYALTRSSEPHVKIDLDRLLTLLPSFADMEEDSGGGEIVEAVITCDGHLDDPSFKKNFRFFLRRLKKIITAGLGKGNVLFTAFASVISCRVSRVPLVSFGLLSPLMSTGPVIPGFVIYLSYFYLAL